MYNICFILFFLCLIFYSFYFWISELDRSPSTCGAVASFGHRHFCFTIYVYYCFKLIKIHINLEQNLSPVTQKISADKNGLFLLSPWFLLSERIVHEKNFPKIVNIPITVFTNNILKSKMLFKWELQREALDNKIENNTTSKPSSR